MISENKNVKKFTSIALLVFLTGLIVFNAFPGLIKGVDNLRIIKHFHSDEGEIVGFYNDFYKSFIITPPAIVAYPTMFYYTAGIFLFPYSHFNKDGDNHKVVAITFRFLNTFSIILITFFVYFLALYLSKSRFFSFILSLLMLTTPGYLYWGLNSRPHPFEILLLFISIAFGLTCIDRKKIQDLIMCLVFAALAFSTKYGGIFIIPPVFAFFLYYFSHERSKPFQIINRFYRMIYSFSFLVITFSLATVGLLYFFLIPLATKITKIGSKLGVAGLMSLKLFQFTVIGLIFVSILGCIWFLLNLCSGKIMQQYKKDTLSFSRIDNFILLTNFSFLFLFLIALVFSIVFIITNPHAIIHPIATSRAFFGLGLIEFSFSKQGEGIMREWLVNLTWFKLLFDKHNLGFSGILLLLWYLLFELTNLKRNLHIKKHLILQRLFIWLYIVTNFVFLLIFIKFRAPHYLLLITFLLLFISLMGIKESLQLISKSKVRKMLLFLFICLISWNLIERMPLFMRYYSFVNTKDKDTGFIVGEWLENNFNDDTIIWRDSMTFYIPPKFKNIHSIWWHEDIDIKKIKELDSDILIITCQLDPELRNVLKINQAINGNYLSEYKLVKTFEYTGPLSIVRDPDRGMFKEINIYENWRKQTK